MEWLALGQGVGQQHPDSGFMGSDAPRGGMPRRRVVVRNALKRSNYMVGRFGVRARASGTLKIEKPS